MEAACRAASNAALQDSYADADGFSYGGFGVADDAPDGARADRTSVPGQQPAASKDGGGVATGRLTNGSPRVQWAHLAVQDRTRMK